MQADGKAVVGGGIVIGDTSGIGVARIIGGPLSATPTPTPTVPTVTIAAKTTKLAENGHKDKVIVTRSGDTSSDLTVAYSAKGSATAGINYKKLAGSVVIPASSASAAIKLKPVDDGVADGTLVLSKAKIKILNVNEHQPRPPAVAGHEIRYFAASTAIFSGTELPGA